jgi:hypothetical protein
MVVADVNTAPARHKVLEYRRDHSRKAIQTDTSNGNTGAR